MPGAPADKNTACVRGRLAPTPSGRMHLGNVLAALVAWASARSAGGTVVLRIEDLDPRAQDRAVADTLMRDLEWLGLDWDEGPFFQSARDEVYQKALCRLESTGLTYPCFCSRAELHAATAPHASDGTYVYQGTCRNLSPEEVALRSATRAAATRLMVPAADDPKGEIEFSDRAFGQMREVLARDCGDFLVRRSDGVFAYQLAVVVDDGLMGVTEVVRGRDLLGSCARQTYLARLLGYVPPAYGHVPLVVASDGRRLSKRDHDLDLGELREGGVSSTRICGVLAAELGLVDYEEELTAEEVAGLFSWEALAARHDDILADATLLERLRS